MYSPIKATMKHNKTFPALLLHFQIPHMGEVLNKHSLNGYIHTNIIKVVGGPAFPKQEVDILLSKNPPQVNNAVLLIF